MICSILTFCGEKSEDDAEGEAHFGYTSFKNRWNATGWFHVWSNITFLCLPVTLTVFFLNMFFDLDRSALHLCIQMTIFLKCGGQFLESWSMTYVEFSKGEENSPSNVPTG